MAQAKSGVLVLGGGKVGKSVAELLLACGEGAYRVTLADRDASALKEAAENIARLKDFTGRAPEFATRVTDATDMAQVREALKGHDYVICMLPFNLVKGIAEAANELGVHYFDVTEDVATTDAVRAIEESGRAKVALVPQCGLAPGYIAIAAHDVASQLDQVQNLTLRVGALSQFPTNQLKYNVTWSADGVINEYCEPCNVMLHGHQVKVPALEGHEKFALDGVEYEAFYTSGGVGTLIETLDQKKALHPEANVAYKTIRYPGHRDLMQFLLHDLGLGTKHPRKTAKGHVFDRNLLIDLFDNSLARTLQDVVIVFVNAIGTRAGQPWQMNFRRRIPATDFLGRVWPAIELTTAAGVCAMVDLHRLGKLPRKTGFIRQEEISLADFNKTVFGLAYEEPSALAKAVAGK